ncbi:MAG: YidC/Oxa1 family membrane protein insertase [Oscillospiraceae bacterium]|nr:YidC/Oxa1 family membrane protein insertase [Oscillospiraceae bacterium]
MLDAIAKPFGKLMLWFYNWTGNYGVAVILFALVVKLILLPFQLKSKKSTMRTSRMTPRLKELEKKYGNDQQKYQQEVSKLYKEEGVNPMSGCLWSLLPYPILLALWRAIRYPLTVMMGVSSDLLSEGGAIYEKLVELGYNLADYSTRNTAETYEQIFQSQFITEHFSDFSALSDKLQAISYKFLGMDLGQTPSFRVWAWDWSSPSVWGPALGLFLIPVLAAVLSWLSMKVSMASQPQTKDTQSTNATMTLMMPVISLWICFTMPGVMGIYWCAQYVFSMIQDVILTRIFNRQLDIEDAERIEREKAREAELEAKRLATEKLKAEGATTVNKNTSKKKQQAAAAQKETERKAAEARAAKLAKRGRTGEEVPPSQVGNRRYARGRAYVPDRYSNPEEAAEKTAAAAAESADYEAEYDGDEATAETVTETAALPESKAPAEDKPAEETVQAETDAEVAEPQAEEVTDEESDDADADHEPPAAAPAAEAAAPAEPMQAAEDDAADADADAPADDN